MNGDLHWHSGQKCPPPPQHSQPRKIRQTNKVQYVILSADLQTSMNMGTSSEINPFPRTPSNFSLLLIQQNNQFKFYFCTQNESNVNAEKYNETHPFLLRHNTTFSVGPHPASAAYNASDGKLGVSLRTKQPFLHTHIINPALYLHSYIRICTTLVILF